MRVQGCKASKVARAEIALKSVAIPSGVCSPSIDSSIRVGMRKEALRDKVVSVVRADVVVDYFTSDA